VNPLESKIKNATKCFNRYKVETTNGLEHARYVVILKTNGDKGRVFFRGKKRSKELITVAIYGDNDSFDIVHFRYCRIHLSQHAANDYARLFTDRWRIDEKTRFIMEDNFYVDESIYVFIYTIRLMGKFYLHNISRLEMYRRVNKECHYLKIPHFTNRHKKPLVEKYFGQDYGEYCYDGLERRTYVQGMAQLNRNVEMREDIRKDTCIRELDQLESMALILSERSGEQLVYATLGNEVQINEVTARNWVSVLNSFFFGFLVKPWSTHVENSIRKTPKWYLRDWSGIADAGKRNETIVACHLLKAVEYWTDLGFGEYDLYYIRDKQKNEVDFLVSKNKRPWFLVEVKTGDVKLSPALKRFQSCTGAKHAFQVVFDLPFEAIDCFSYTEPVVVPAKTFLSQLV